jgi:hypothetical protein
VQAPGIRKAGAAQADLEPPMFRRRIHRALRVTANELREVLTELAQTELSPANLALLAGIEQ